MNLTNYGRYIVDLHTGKVRGPNRIPARTRDARPAQRSPHASEPEMIDDIRALADHAVSRHEWARRDFHGLDLARRVVGPADPHTG